MEMPTDFFVKADVHKESHKPESPDLEESLLWNLHLRRKEVFQEMNGDVEEIVNLCLEAKQNLEALEDSNRNLQSEVRSLRRKYEDLLEKNKKDTRIIMDLKDSESLLKNALKCKKKTADSLLKMQIKNQEKALERKLLQDDREKLLFKSQVITNILRKINLKHKRIYEMIKDKQSTGEENERRLTQEIKDLRSSITKNDDILEEWLKDNIKRDAAINFLQEEIRNGLSAYAECSKEGSTSEEQSEVETDSVEEETEQSVPKENQQINEQRGCEKNDPRETEFHQEWMKKQILFGAAEKQKEHWMDFYMLLIKRMRDLNIEVVNVRQWRIDKGTELRELTNEVKKMEVLVSQKRRGKPVPERSPTDEMNIWIKIQLEANEMLRKILSRCLSIKMEDSAAFSEFVKSVRNMYLDALKEKSSVESGNENKSAEREPSTGDEDKV